MREEDQQSGYEWSKLSLASTGKFVEGMALKRCRCKLATLLDCGEGSYRMDSAESVGVVCCDFVASEQIQILETVRHSTVLTQGHISDLIAKAESHLLHLQHSSAK